MGTEQVRIWRPAEEDRVLLLAGHTTDYAIQPRGEYVFGVVTGAPMRSRRGRERRLVQPGELVAWDPSGAHSGTAADTRPWSSRLMIVEAQDLAALAGEADDDVCADLAFPEPVLSDPGLTAGFLRLHGAYTEPATRLERDEQLAEWLRGVVDRSGAVRTPRRTLTGRDDQALRRAHDYIGDHADLNISLDELAAAAGVGKYRLIRLFRDHTGLPPHALQLAHRLRRARRLLETGATIADTATATGFADQSHLHRHFQRGLGMTPGQYQHRFDQRKDERG